MADRPSNLRGRWRSRAVPGIETAELLAHFAESPQAFIRSGTVYKPGSRGFAVMAEIAGRPCFVKHYRCQGWAYRLSYLFRPSRAARTFAVTRRFAALGIPVAAPLFFLEERSLGLLGDSYLATEFIPGCNLQEYWRDAAAGERREVMRQCAIVLGKLHGAGCCHGDLKWNNLLVRQGGDGPEIILVDVDAATCWPWPWQRVKADLRRFLSDLQAADPAGTEQARFLGEWTSWQTRR